MMSEMKDVEAIKKEVREHWQKSWEIGADWTLSNLDRERFESIKAMFEERCTIRRPLEAMNILDLMILDRLNEILAIFDGYDETIEMEAQMSEEALRGMDWRSTPYDDGEAAMMKDFTLEGSHDIVMAFWKPSPFN
jgi:hypothetical protein